MLNCLFTRIQRLESVSEMLKERGEEYTTDGGLYNE